MRPTQNERLLTALRNAGDRGVHSFSLRREPPYIGNPSERVRELERHGHVIRAERERLNGDAWGCRYFLDFDAGAREPAITSVTVDSPAPAPPTHPGDDPHARDSRLFDIQPTPLGAYDQAA